MILARSSVELVTAHADLPTVISVAAVATAAVATAAVATAVAVFADASGPQTLHWPSQLVSTHGRNQSSTALVDLHPSCAPSQASPAASGGGASCWRSAARCASMHVALAVH